MAFYSDQHVKTRYLDPSIYVPNKRATFHLDMNHSSFLPNMRLINIGGAGTAVDSYNRLLGALACIKSLRLLDGKTELSQINEFQIYRGFLNINKPNAMCGSVTKKLEQSGIGWELSTKSDQATMVGDSDSGNNVGDSENATYHAYLDLREVFPILAATSHLPTAIFKNLRVEIDYDTTSTTCVNTTTTTFNTSRPVLVYDVLEDPQIVAKMNKQFKNIVWLETEHDRFLIKSADGSATAVQAISPKLNGFNNKILERLLMVKTVAPTAPGVVDSSNKVLGFGNASGQTCHNEKIQLRINGRNILPREGVVGPNERLSLLVDTFGECFSYLGANKYGLKGQTKAQIVDGQDYQGSLDYFGIYLSEYIQDLQINYERTNLQSSTVTGAKNRSCDLMHAHVFGEVRKQLVLNTDGSYVVSYQQ